MGGTYQTVGTRQGYQQAPMTTMVQQAPITTMVQQPVTTVVEQTPTQIVEELVHKNVIEEVIVSVSRTVIETQIIIQRKPGFEYVEKFVEVPQVQLQEFVKEE